MIKHWDNCHIFYMDILLLETDRLMVCAWLGGTIPMGLEHFPWWLHRLHTLDHPTTARPRHQCYGGRFHDTRVDPSSQPAALAPTIVTRRWSPRSHRAQSRARNLGLGRGAGTRVASCGRHPFQCVAWCSHLSQRNTFCVMQSHFPTCDM